MRKCVVALGLALLSLATPKIWADGIGLTLQGVLTTFNPGDMVLQPSHVTPNYLENSSGLVPPGYGNSGNNQGTAVISASQIEYGLNDNNVELITVDFTGTTVTLTEQCLAAGCGITPFTFAVYSPFITGYTMISDTFTNDVAGYGDTFYPGFGNAGAFTSLGQSGTPGTMVGQLVASYTSITPPPASPALRTFALASASFLDDPAADPPADPDPVPEPASIGLMATGLLGVAGLLRKRFA
jgi:hypothetical protein